MKNIQRLKSHVRSPFIELIAIAGRIVWLLLLVFVILKAITIYTLNCEVCNVYTEYVEINVRYYIAKIDQNIKAEQRGNSP
jgi:hypothetical protein